MKLNRHVFALCSKVEEPIRIAIASAGENNVEQMKSLAQAGAGLSAFITRNVRYDYE